ncbi:GbsR/MarR family transcriptional regulator [Gilvimarinus algae]|uniref:HTH-type transcriptional regulator n=1 Tax=Gilvimarinus algae TaxID=3058037 RepID=A0ABT8TDU1_9GAMM|nr:GbsR/MarR family transcriptional regulator [Gilvimarinus sp. SDUM040014]MDO3382095.1 GbsR/MarR family transcriptional regulator [Gilvimarinus sp. SDUM040014]
MSPLVESFVRHFGEMGSRWGINRTVGQMYAYIVLADEPVNADELAAELRVSRSNVSMGLKELQSWNLVRLKHIPGDRKDYFVAPEDVWEIASTLINERRKREIDPTLTVMRELLMDTPSSAADRHAQNRIKEMYQLIEMLTQWSAEMQKLSPKQISRMLKLGAGVSKLLG